MLEHLITGDYDPVVRENAPEAFVRLDRASVSDVVDAQVSTAQWLREAGLHSETILPDIEKQQARSAFSALTVADVTQEEAKEKLVTLHMPEQIRHLVGMLTAYDWEFVHQAKEIRGFVVTKLLQEAEKAPRPGDRLKALALLGKVTEVGLFTDKIEVTKDRMSDEDLDAKIKEKLLRFTGQAVGAVTDIEGGDAEG